MITLKLHKDFLKQAAGLKPAQKKRLQAALRLFQNEPQHPNLYNHPLTGQWKGYRSKLLAVTGELILSLRTMTQWLGLWLAGLTASFINSRASVFDGRSCLIIHRQGSGICTLGSWGAGFASARSV